MFESVDSFLASLVALFELLSISPKTLSDVEDTGEDATLGDDVEDTGEEAALGDDVGAILPTLCTGLWDGLVCLLAPVGGLAAVWVWTLVGGVVSLGSDFDSEMAAAFADSSSFCSFSHSFLALLHSSSSSSILLSFLFNSATDTFEDSSSFCSFSRSFFTLLQSISSSSILLSFFFSNSVMLLSEDFLAVLSSSSSLRRC